MSPTVIAALITAFTSIFIGFISFFRKPSTQIPVRREIKYKQLVDLFDPLETLFATHQTTNESSLLDEISKIVNENLLIVPTDLLDTIEQIRKKPTIDERDIALLHRDISSYYHLRRKLFGYPYKKDRIKPRKLILLNIEIALDRYYYLGCLCGCAAAATLILYIESHAAAPYALAATSMLLFFSILHLLKTD